MIAAIRALLTQDVLPTTLVFAVVVALLVRYAHVARHGERGEHVVESLAQQARRLASTIAGGFLVFVFLTAGISVLAGESGDYIEDSLVGGAVLAFGVVVPFFALAIRLGHSVARRRRSG
jgi:hypothetical protein